MGFLKTLPVVGDVVKVLDRPGDILKNPLGTLMPLAGDALTLGGIPGVGGPLASFAKGASPFMKYAGLASSLAGGHGGGGIGNLANGIGSAFGMKPFGGGQYQDGGFGNDVTGYARTMGGNGASLMNYGVNGIPNSANLLTQMVGLPNPNGPMTLSNNPWTPNQMQQEAINRQNDTATEDANSMKSRVKQQLMENGINDPEHIAAAMNHIDQELARTKNSNLGNAQQSAFNNRMNVAGMLPGIYQNAASLGMGGLGSAGGLQLSNANNAFGMRRYNDANMIGGLGMAGSGRLGQMARNIFGIPKQKNSTYDENAANWGLNNGGFENYQFLYGPQTATPQMTLDSNPWTGSNQWPYSAGTGEF